MATLAAAIDKNKNKNDSKKNRSAPRTTASKHASKTQKPPVNSFDVAIDPKHLTEIQKVILVPENTVVSKKNKKRARDLEATAMLYRSEGQYHECVAKLTEAIKYDPTETDLWVSRGDAYLQLNRVHACIGDCTTAILHYNSSMLGKVFRLRGRAHGMAGDWLRSCLDFFVYILHDPCDSEAKVWFAEARETAQVELDLLWFKVVHLEFLKAPTNLIQAILDRRNTGIPIRYNPVVTQFLDKVTADRRYVLRVMGDPFGDKLIKAITQCKSYLTSLGHDKYLPNIGGVLRHDELSHWLEPSVKAAKGPLAIIATADFPDIFYYQNGSPPADIDLRDIPWPSTKHAVMYTQSPYYNVDYNILATGFLPDGPLPIKRSAPPPPPPRTAKTRPTESFAPLSCSTDTKSGRTCIKVPSSISQAAPLPKKPEVEPKPEVVKAVVVATTCSVASQTLPYGIKLNDSRYDYWCRALTGEWEHLVDLESVK